MSILTRITERWPKTAPLQYIPPTAWSRQRPTHAAARPAIIDAALARALRRPSGNWYVFAASDSIRTDRPFGTHVGGVEVVAWRDSHRQLHVGPGACPHLGAQLSTGRVDCGALVCPWHGLRIDGTRELGGKPAWKPFPQYDDGVLCWVRLDAIGGEAPTDRPVVPVRPDGSRMHAVTRLEGVCEPADIIANRLDPWHGSWYHPYSFSQLDVITSPPVSGAPDDDADRFLVSVTFHIGRLGVPVVAEFSCPEPRTVVMRIVDGEGTGSVVETHATPLGADLDGRPRTAVVEAVIAHSDRSGFAHARRASLLIKPLMRHAATRLWRDDLAYAERRYTQRSRSAPER